MKRDDMLRILEYYQFGATIKATTKEGIMFEVHRGDKNDHQWSFLELEYEVLEVNFNNDVILDIAPIIQKRMENIWYKLHLKTKLVKDNAIKKIVADETYLYCDVTSPKARDYADKLVKANKNYENSVKALYKAEKNYCDLLVKAYSITK